MHRSLRNREEIERRGRRKCISEEEEKSTHITPHMFPDAAGGSIGMVGGGSAAMVADKVDDSGEAGDNLREGDSEGLIETGPGPAVEVEASYEKCCIGVE